MKKIILTLLISVMLFALCSCGNGGTYKISLSQDQLSTADSFLTEYYILYTFDFFENGTKCVHHCVYTDESAAQKAYDEAVSGYGAADVQKSGTSVVITYTENLYTYVEMLEFYSSFTEITKN